MPKYGPARSIGAAVHASDSRSRFSWEISRQRLSIWPQRDIGTLVPSPIVAHDDDEPIAQTSLGFDRVHHSVGAVCCALEMRGRVELGDGRVHPLHEDMEDLAAALVVAQHFVALRHAGILGPPDPTVTLQTPRLNPVSRPLVVHRLL